MAYNALDLNLSGRLAEEWICFLSGIKHNAIALSNNPDSLVWSWNKEDGVVKVKEAYDALVSH